MDAKGFLTRNELSEGVAYSKLDTRTQYQDLRLVRLFVKQATGVRFFNINTDHKDFKKWVDKSIEFFKNEGRNKQNHTKGIGNNAHSN